MEGPLLVFAEAVIMNPYDCKDEMASATDVWKSDSVMFGF